MIVVIDGRRYDIAEGIGDGQLPSDVKAAKVRVHQHVFRGDAGWYQLADGGEVLINWRAVKTVDVYQHTRGDGPTCPNRTDVRTFAAQEPEWACTCRQS